MASKEARAEGLSQVFHNNLHYDLFPSQQIDITIFFAPSALIKSVDFCSSLHVAGCLKRRKESDRPGLSDQESGFGKGEWEGYSIKNESLSLEEKVVQRSHHRGAARTCHRIRRSSTSYFFIQDFQA